MFKDDEELIISYLNKSFQPIVNHKENINTYYNFLLFDKNTNEVISFFELLILLKKIFYGNYEIDKILMFWFKEKIKILADELINFLNSCKIELTINKWLVRDQDNNIISIKYLQQKYQNLYGKHFISEYYDTWLSDKIIEITENTLKTF